MLTLVLRKMTSNKWMVICLLVGTLLAVAMLSSIPMYTQAILNRMLIKDMEGYQRTSNSYPGQVVYSSSLESNVEPQNRYSAFTQLNDLIVNLKKEVPIPANQETITLTVTSLSYKLKTPHGNVVEEPPMNLVSSQNLMDHIRMYDGRKPEKKGDGTYEVMLSLKTMSDSDYRVGDVFSVTDRAGRIEKPLTFEVVGIFTMDPESPLYWYDAGERYNTAFAMPYEWLYEDFIPGKESFIGTVSFNTMYDYRSIHVNNIGQVISSLGAMQKKLNSYHIGKCEIGVLSLLEGYGDRENTLRTTLLVLQVPLFVMLAFYLFMVSRLIVRSERAEISVFQSRGSSDYQIFLLYLYESAIIGAISLVIGPLLGYGVVSIVGASNGFLQFIRRSALAVEITPSAILYSLYAIVFSMIMILLPALTYSRESIVEQKRKRWDVPLWQKLFLDVWLLGISVYGYYTYKTQHAFIIATQQNASSNIPVDPLLFLVSTIFILGAGLLFLRLYPYFLRLIYYIGRRFWSSSAYTGFLQVIRTFSQAQFMILFFIITLSMGIFYANAAQTVNMNLEEIERYKNGADLVVQPIWDSNAVVDAQTGQTVPAGDSQGYANTGKISYTEPDFSLYEGLAGTKAAAKVRVKEEIPISVDGKPSGIGKMQAIDPNTYAQVAHMPNGILPYHWYNYLNLLTSSREACLISSEFAEYSGAKTGDTVYIVLSGRTIPMRAYAIIDFWPGINTQMKTEKMFIVCNLSYLDLYVPAEPYQIWYKEAPNATTAEIYADIEKKGLKFSSISDVEQTLIQVRNDPMLQGTNGAMTMAFLVTMAICSIGFLLYWIVSIRSRVLQFGIFRAMGMTFGMVLRMLGVEQLLVSFLPIFVGVTIGSITSYLYVPLLQLVYDSSNRILPFRVMSSQTDYLRIYAFVFLVILVGFMILAWIIRKIRIAQALKLGEE
ncbi:MAG: FtsX-like permease family protein [Clostridia bacterium]|nr:FtsX-like permease family protein [Clostridia bacterium]